MTEDKNMIKIQALEALQKIIFDRAEMLHNVCFTDEAMNIYSQCYGEKFDRLYNLRNNVLRKQRTLLEVIDLLSKQIIELCMD